VVELVNLKLLGLFEIGFSGLTIYTQKNIIGLVGLESNKEDAS